VFSLYIIDENGCENVYNVNIEEQLELPVINLIADNITCNNSMATITLESQSELTDVVWSDANEVVSTDNQLAVDQGGWYYVQGSNQYGCESEDSILVLENITAPVLILLSPDTIKLLPNGFYDILIDEFSSGNLDYSWMPTEGLSCSDCLEPTITEYLHDSYQLTVTNDYGCITTITIHVREKKLTSVNIPNIFSPSSRDGNNDYFTLYGNENVVLINEMYVYDRWGNLVYSNNNFLPNDPYQGWDGLFNGESVVNGVYVYLFKVTTNEGQILTFAGDITKM
jgi:gliding motility-associated-like protein